MTKLGCNARISEGRANLPQHTDSECVSLLREEASIMLDWKIFAVQKIFAARTWLEYLWLHCKGRL